MTLPCQPVTSLQDIADRGFTASKGKMPSTGDREITTLYRCGWVGKTPHKASALRWDITGHDWDAVGWK